MAEDAWLKKRKRAADSSSDYSDPPSSSCESQQGREDVTDKTRSIFNICSQSGPKSVLTTPITKERGFISIESASSSGLRKRKCQRGVAKGVKRRLWDADSVQVDLDLDRELTRMRKVELLEKSAKWNYDFERETPLSGEWGWYSTKSAPEFYKTKEISSKFKPIHQPTISKWTTEFSPIQIATSTERVKLIRPKPIRPSTSKPAAMGIGFSKKEESIKALQSKITDTRASSKLLETSSNFGSKTTSSKSGDKREKTQINTSRPVLNKTPKPSYTTTETKTLKQMTLRPRKRQKLERKKSSELKRFR